MEISHSSEILGHQPPVKGVKAFYSTILLIKVSTHEIHVWSQILKESTCKIPAQHRYPYIGIGNGQ